MTEHAYIWEPLVAPGHEAKFLARPPMRNPTMRETPLGAYDE